MHSFPSQSTPTVNFCSPSPGLILTPDRPLNSHERSCLRGFEIALITSAPPWPGTWPSVCPLNPSTLLQYVDDLLLCSPSKDLSKQYTITLLNFLASKGYRASQSKAQLTQSSVTYLGLQITPTTKALTTDWCQLLQSIQSPTNGDQILSFLGLAGFFHHWVPNYTSLAKPLYAAAKETPKGPLSSQSEVTRAFLTLQSALTSAAPLSLPNPNYPYHLYTDEKGGKAFGALVQPVDSELLPVAFISKQLDPTARGWFPCL